MEQSDTRTDSSPHFAGNSPSDKSCGALSHVYVDFYFIRVISALLCGLGDQFQPRGGGTGNVDSVIATGLSMIRTSQRTICSLFCFSTVTAKTSWDLIKLPKSLRPWMLYVE